MDSQRLSRTFVGLADSLVEGWEALDSLQLLVESCVDLLDISAAGVLLADEQDQLHVAASSSEGTRLLDLYQLQNEEGPCLECYHTGQPISVQTLVAEQGPWPQFAAAAVDEGFGSVVALPLRLRSRVVGALNIFGGGDGALDDPDLEPVAQALADVCTISILHDRKARGREVLTEQLQHALHSRVSIEQAKGVLSARFDIGVTEAFELLRKRARDTRRPLGELAKEVVTSTDHDDVWMSLRPR